MPEYEFDQWIYEFKRRWRGDEGPPSLGYEALRQLLEMWNLGMTPKAAVTRLRERDMVANV